MQSQISITLIVSLLVCVLAEAQDTNFSGPQRGEEITTFKVLEVTGPFDAREVAVVKPEEKGATLLMFLQKVTEPALGLMISLEWYANKQPGLNSHYVILTNDQSKTEQQVKRWAERSFFADSNFSICLDGPEGPGQYGLNRNVDMTVLVAKENKVVGNFAINAPNNTDAPKILNALASALDKPAPSYDNIQNQLRIQRNQRREMRMREHPVFKSAPDRQLGQLMMNMMNRENQDPEYFKKSANRMMDWAGEKKEKKDALVKFCKEVLNGDFDMRLDARKALEQLAGE